jgi:hypothetical protein
LDFSCAVAPTFDAAARCHEPPSLFHLATRTRTTVTCPQISTSMTFSADFIMERVVPYDGNRQQSFASLLLKPSGRIKNTRAYDQIPSDPAISRHEAPNEVCRRSLLEHNTSARTMRTGIREIVILTRDGTLGPPPLFGRASSPHTVGQLPAIGTSGPTTLSDEHKICP